MKNNHNHHRDNHMTNPDRVESFENLLMKELPIMETTSTATTTTTTTHPFSSTTSPSLSCVDPFVVGSTVETSLDLNLVAANPTPRLKPSFNSSNDSPKTATETPSTLSSTSLSPKANTHVKSNDIASQGLTLPSPQPNKTTDFIIAHPINPSYVTYPTSSMNQL